MRGGLHQYFRRVHQIWKFSQVGSAISVLLTKSQFEHCVVLCRHRHRNEQILSVIVAAS